MMKNVSKQAKCSKPYTNHSIRATTVTALHAAAVSDHQIMSITGHRNSASLQSYQHPNMDQTIAMASILDGKSSEEDLLDIGPMEVSRLLSGLKEDDLSVLHFTYGHSWPMYGNWHDLGRSRQQIIGRVRRRKSKKPAHQQCQLCGCQLHRCFECHCKHKYF